LSRPINYMTITAGSIVLKDGSISSLSHPSTFLFTKT
jgi:hypothetical protein